MSKLVVSVLLFCLISSIAKGNPGSVIVQKDIKLSSSDIEVDLAAGQPQILGYHLASKQSAQLAGAPDAMGPEVRFFDTKKRIERSSYDATEVEVTYTLKSDAHNALYDCHMDYNGKSAGDFQIIFSLSENKLTVTGRLIREADPVEVLSIKLPLVTVLADSPTAKMAFPVRSGRLIDIRKSDPMQYVHKVDWFNEAPMGMIYNENLLAMVSLNSLDDQMISKISGAPKSGTVSVEFVRRPRAENPDLSFIVQRDSSCSVTLIGSQNGRPADWTDGAISYRSSIPKNIKALYQGACIYKIMLDEPNGSTRTTLDEAFDLIKRVGRLTGGAPQVVYLIGWQHEGHDTGYPDTSVFNDHVGTVEEFKKLVEAAKLENAVVSIHDNYHDAYRDSPAWDANVISVDSNGELAKGGVWGGGQAFVLSPSAYLTKAQDRARKTIDMLGIEKTVHLDVLSDDPERIDFNPVSPAGRQRNVAAKLALISTFNQRGIDVTSEILTSPFVGRISHFWRVENRPATYWSSEEPIPLVPMIFHGKVTAGGGDIIGNALSGLILNGWTFTADFCKSTRDSEIMDDYYLITLPWSALASLEMSGYENKDGVEKVTYGPNTYVEINRAKDTYKVVYDGKVIASDYSTMMLRQDGTIMVYSRDGGKVTVDVPASWTDKSKLKVMQLVQSAASSYSFSNGKLTITAGARVPYRITYGEK